jgi:hypothetical protein
MGADGEIELHRGGGSILPHAAHRAGHQQDVQPGHLQAGPRTQGRGRGGGIRWLDAAWPQCLSAGVLTFFTKF